MQRLEKTFNNKKENLLNVYFTAGFPALEDTETIIRSLSESGVDVIEVGMPQEVGIDGLILPDLPLSVYEAEYQDLFKKYNLAPIFLITPQTSEERIRKIDQLSQGFIYVVSSAAITGNSKEISPEQLAYFQRIENMNLRLPRMIGFGISDHQSFTTA